MKSKPPVTAMGRGVVGVVAACLSFGVAGVASAAPLTQGELVRRGNAICSTVTTKVRTLNIGQGTTRTEVRDGFARLHTLEEGQLAGLTRLTPPRLIAAAYAANLVRHRQFNQSIQVIVRHLDRGATPAVVASDMARVERYSNAFDRVAFGMGLTACTAAGTKPVVNPAA